MTFFNNNNNIKGLVIRNDLQLQPLDSLQIVKVNFGTLPKFNYEELNKLFQEQGLDALLKQLQELSNKGVITDLTQKVSSENKKTIVTCKYRNVEYTFEEPVADTATTTAKKVNKRRPPAPSSRPVPPPPTPPVATDSEDTPPATNPDVVTSSTTTSEEVPEETPQATTPDVTPPTTTPSTTTTSNDFKTMCDMFQFVHNECASAIMEKYPNANGSVLHSILEIIAQNYRDDFQGLAKAQLQQECMDAYEEYVRTGKIPEAKTTTTTTEAAASATNPTETTAPTNTNNTFNTSADLSDYLYSDEFKNAVKAQYPSINWDDDETDAAISKIYKKYKSNLSGLTKEAIVSEFVGIVNPKMNPADVSSKLASVIDGILNNSAMITGLVGPNVTNISFKEDDASSTRYSNAMSTLINGIKTQMENLINGKPEIEKAVKALGNGDLTKGKEVLYKLLEAACIADSNSNELNKQKFIETSLKTLKGLIDIVAKNPELVNVYTVNAFANTGVNGSYSDKVKINADCIDSKKFMDAKGRPHIDDDAMDKKYQELTDKLLDKYKEMFPNVKPEKIESWFRTAQQNVFRNMSYYTSETSMATLINETKRQFETLLFKNVSANDYLSDEEVAKAKANNTAWKAPESSKDYSYLIDAMDDCLEDIDDAFDSTQLRRYVKDYGSSVHTEFGMDFSGNIIFESEDAKKLFEDLCNDIAKTLGSSTLKELGNGSKDEGKTVLKKLIQAAWIDTYNSYNSAQKNDTEKFVKKVGENLKKMMKSLKDNPQNIEILTQRTTYGNSTFVSGLRGYNDTTLNYGGTVKNDSVTKYADGTIHLSNTHDDIQYQTLMDGLLKQIISRYPSVDPAKLTELFRKAQEKALVTAAKGGDVNDCPFGTGTGDSVTNYNPYTWDHNDKNSRKGDKDKISANQLAQLTLYNFDKLLYQYIAG